MNCDRINIAYVVSSLRRCGPINVLMGIVKHIDQSKFNPYIITLSGKEASDSRYSEFVELGVKIIQFDLKWNRILFAHIQFAKILDEHKIHIIHNHGIRPDWISRRLKKHFVIVSTAHNYPIEDYTRFYGRLVGGVMGIVHIHLLKYNNNTVAVSQHLKDFLGCDMYIDNGIELVSDVQTKEKSKNKTKWLYVGELIHRKDLSTLISAFKMLNKYEHELTIVGSGLFEKQLKLEAKGCENIYFIGRVSNVKEYYVNADFFVFPTLSESFGLVCVEAMSFGVPLLASNIVANKYFFKKNKSVGEMFNVGDCYSLYHKMCQINIANYKVMSEASISLSKCFTAEVMSQKYQKYYLSLIE